MYKELYNIREYLICSKKTKKYTNILYNIFIIYLLNKYLLFIHLI